MPDSSILVDSTSKNGISINLMVNNLIYWEYHRPNGLTAFKHKFNNKAEDKLYTSTEGYVSLMNFFSNSFLKANIKKDQRTINAYISPTVDSDVAASFVDSIEGSPGLRGFIETIVFPLGQCLGLPIMLYVLVMEKEEKLKSLLEIMGLKATNYWKAHIVFYSLMFMTSNLIFYGFGKAFLGGKFFENANQVLLVDDSDLAGHLPGVGPQPNWIGFIYEHFHRKQEIGSV